MKYKETDSIEDKVRNAVEIEREACALLATSFLVGDPLNGVPLRNPTCHEVANKIRSRTTGRL